MSNRRFRETQECIRRKDNKNNTLEQISEIKKKLGKDRERYKQDLSFQRKSMEVRDYRPKFNSFFDL